MRLSPALFGLMLVVSGTLLRLGLVLLLRDVTVMPSADVKTADDVEFNALALNVARGDGFNNADGRVTSFRAPGYPLFVAGLYAAFGERSWVVYLASCALGGVSCLLAYLIARRLMSERLARVAGVLCVVFLPHAYFAVMFWSEDLFVPLFAAAVWILVIVLTNRTGSGGELAPGITLLLVAGAGLLLGAAALTRPFALLAAPLFALVLLVNLRWRGLLAGAVLGMATAVVVVPWTYRNQRVHDRFVAVATNGGSTFYGGNNDTVVSEWRQFGSWISTTDLPGRAEIEAAPDEVSHDKVEWDLGVRWIRENPGKAALLLPLKILRLILWLPDFDGGKRSYYLVRAAGWLPFLLLIAAGLWRGRGALNGPGWWILHAAVLATALTAMIFWGSPRFRDANAPLLMAYAALAFRRHDETTR
jgi:4-amino-4-deoxy-L-arabinose transferase-like glycosyltransferase